MKVKFETKCEICGKALPVGSEAEGIKEEKWYFYCPDCFQIYEDANKFYDFLETSDKSREIKKEMRQYVNENHCPREVAEAIMFRKYFCPLYSFCC
jgi:hypothetical protein